MSYHYNHGINSHENSAAIAANNAASAASAAASAASLEIAQAYATAEDAERRLTVARMDLAGQKSLAQDDIGELWGAISSIYKDLTELNNLIAKESGEISWHRRKIFELGGKVGSLQAVLESVAEKVETNQEIQDVALDMISSLRSNLLTLAEKFSPESAEQMKNMFNYAEKPKKGEIEREEEEMVLVKKLLPKMTATFEEARYALAKNFITIRDMCLKYFEPVDGQDQFAFKPEYGEHKQLAEKAIQKDEGERTLDELALLIIQHAANRLYIDLAEEEVTTFMRENEKARNIVEDYRIWDCADTQISQPSVGPYILKVTDEMIALKKNIELEPLIATTP